MKKSTEQQTPDQAASLRELGRLVGKAASTVMAWVKHPAWPFGPGPWKASDAGAMVEWAERTFAAARSDPAVKAARVKLLTEQLRTLNLANRLAAGRYVRAEEAEGLVVRAIHALKATLRDLVVTSPVTEEIEHGTQASIEAAIETKLREAAEAFAACAGQVRRLRRRFDLRRGGRPGNEAEGQGAAGPGKARAPAAKAGGRRLRPA